MAEDMRPLSMDDYTDTEFTGQKKTPLVETLGLIPYGARENSPLGVKIRAGLNKLGAFILQDNDAVMDAFQIARDIAEEYQFEDEDATEDTIRHILLGGLVESVQGQAFIAGREGDDAESKIDHNNNLYGKALREKYPDRDEFIKKAIDNALLIGQGKDPEEAKGMRGIKSFGNIPVRDEFVERAIASEKSDDPRLSDQDLNMIEDNEAPIPQNMLEPDPMKSTDDYTVTQRKGGIMKAQTGTMPLTEKTSPPVGNKPKDEVPITNPIGRPKQPESNDPRDIAIAKLENALMRKNMPTKAKKGTVKIDEELKEGTKPKDSAGVAVMIGLGAPEIDYSKGEEGDPPPGATKKEIADDQMVLLSEGELVVPANVVRFHGLATYEGMRREALTGLQAMESDGQISYITDGKTKKTRQGGIMKAQQGIIPLPGQQYTPTYQQPIVEAASSQFITTPEGTQVYTPSVTQQALATPVNPQITPVYTQTPGLATRVVAPNIGYFLPEEQRLSYMRPDAPPSGFVPAPGVPVTPPDDPTPDPIIDEPEQPKPVEPTPDPISEEAEKYIESGAGQQELAKVFASEQNAMDERQAIDAATRSGPPPEFQGFGKAYDNIKAMNQNLKKEAFKDAFDKMRTDTSKEISRLFGPPVKLEKITGKLPPDSPQLYKNMPFTNVASAFMESLTDPETAALRKTDVQGIQLYNPKKFYEVDPTTGKARYMGGYEDVDPVTGKAVSTLTKFESDAAQRREDASDRRTEREEKNAKDYGFASQGITKITTQEIRAYQNINKALNNGQFDPNGLMGVEQYADFKKVGLQLKDFFKLSRAEQSFYAAARTGDTVQPWVIESMKQGTTQAFDDMNRFNKASVISDDKYEIQSNKQFKPADAKEGFEVSPITYWQSEEGKKKAEELGVKVG